MGNNRHYSCPCFGCLKSLYKKANAKIKGEVNWLAYFSMLLRELKYLSFRSRFYFSKREVDSFFFFNIGLDIIWHGDLFWSWELILVVPKQRGTLLFSGFGH